MLFCFTFFTVSISVSESFTYLFWLRVSQDVDQRWAEYQSRFSSLLQWTRQHTSLMANKNFPQNPVELKVSSKAPSCTRPHTYYHPAVRSLMKLSAYTFIT